MKTWVRLLAKMPGVRAAVIVKEHKAGNGKQVYASGYESALMAALRAILDEMKKDGKSTEEIIQVAESYLSERQ